MHILPPRKGISTKTLSCACQGLFSFCNPRRETRISFDEVAGKKIRPGSKIYPGNFMFKMMPEQDVAFSSSHRIELSLNQNVVK